MCSTKAYKFRFLLIIYLTHWHVLLCTHLSQHHWISVLQRTAYYFKICFISSWKIFQSATRRRICHYLTRTKVQNRKKMLEELFFEHKHSLLLLWLWELYNFIFTFKNCACIYSVSSKSTGSVFVKPVKYDFDVV